jgi:multidrug efflux pump subunit AcrA (membrane-fusion protein)
MLPPAIQALERQGQDGKVDPGALAAQLAQAQQQIQQLGQQLQQAAQAADKERNRVAVEQDKVKVDADANEREAGLKARELELEEQRIAIERTKVRADIASQRRQVMAGSAIVGADGQPMVVSAEPESMPLMDDEVQALAASIGQLGQGLAQIGHAQMAILAELQRQKRVVRGPDGRIIGVQ